MKNYPFLFLFFLLLSGSKGGFSQQLPHDVPLTVRPALQQLGERLLQGKRGSIVAIRPESGEIVCLATHSEAGSDLRMAIATPYPPGSTLKTAQALTLLSEGLVNRETAIPCDSGFLDGNIRVKCHRHRSPLKLVDALAYSCNTWFLATFASMVNDSFLYESRDEAIDTWRDYMRSMGLGGPLGIDIPGEKGGLLANSNYLRRRYPDGWDGKTVMWAGMGQGDVTVTTLQLANLAVTLANQGFYYPPHLCQDTPQRPLAQRYKTLRKTRVLPEAYAPVVEGMRKAVEHGTAYAINSPSYKICGKTGTAETAGPDHSLFIGFAPMQKPKIAIAVVVEHGGFGADMAAPMAALIMEMYLKGKLSEKSERQAQRLSARQLLK